MFVWRSRVKTSVVESGRPLSVASVASMHRVRVCKCKRGDAERLEGHTRTTCRYPGPGSDGIGLILPGPTPPLGWRCAVPCQGQGGCRTVCRRDWDVETRAKVSSRCQCTSFPTAKDSRPFPWLQGPGGVCSRHATDVEATPARVDGRYMVAVQRGKSTTGAAPPRFKFTRQCA